MSGKFVQGAQALALLMGGYAEKQTHMLNATAHERNRFTIRHSRDQRLLTIFASDDITTLYRKFLSATQVPGEVNSSDVKCRYNEECLKEGQAWSFIAVNNGCV